MSEFISVNELRVLGSRVFVYAGIAYAASRVVKFGIGQASRLVELVSNKSREV